MQDAEDLSFRKGDLLNVIVKHEEQWWKAQHQKDLNIGVIPSNYVEYVRDGPLAIEKKKVTAAAALRVFTFAVHTCNISSCGLA